MSRTINQEEFDNRNEFLRVTPTGDDKGLSVESGGQFSVGTPALPAEFVCGEGDSYPIPYAWHIDYANLSGLSVTGAVDVAEILQSDTSSSTGLFDGATNGKALLLMSPYFFGGLKMKYTTLGTVEPENFAIEFLQNNTPTWTDAPKMATDSNFPFTQVGWNISSFESEQIRTGSDPDLGVPQWEDVTISVNGTDYTGKWAVIRLTDAITLDPVVEQVKCHASRYEINSMGNTEYFGFGRYQTTLLDGWKNIINNSSASPANENVAYGTGVTANFLDNQFTNNANDSVLIVQNIPIGLDTSFPLFLDISYYVDGTATGDVEWRAQVFKITDDFVYDGNNVSEDYSVVDTVSASADMVRRTARVKIDIQSLTDNDALLIAIVRDARTSNANDTLAGNCIGTNVRTSGIKWRP